MHLLKYFSVFTLLASVFSGAMEQPGNYAPSIANLHSDHLQNILLKLGSAEEIGRTARALSQVNKPLYQRIQNATPALIQGCASIGSGEGALAIRTKAARMWLQQNLSDEIFKELQYFLDQHVANRNPSKEELAKVRFLLRSFPQIGDCQSCPALLLAGDNLAVVKNLLSCGVNVNQVDDRKIPPLEVACWLNSFDLADALLNAGAKITARCFRALDLHESLLTEPEGLIIQQGPLVINGRPITKRGPATARYSLETLRNLRRLLRKHQIKQNCSIQ